MDRYDQQWLRLINLRPRTPDWARAEDAARAVPLAELWRGGRRRRKHRGKGKI